jgi:DNA-binding LacI/PurR family transcriptional regulator
MARDYGRIVRALRAKAADPVVSDHERRALLDRATAIEANHPEIVTVKSPSTDYTTTVTSRDGFVYDFRRHGPADPRHREWEGPTYEQSWEDVQRLFRNQHMWNKPPVPDEDDLISDEFKHDPGPGDDEDYGYDIYEGEEYE